MADPGFRIAKFTDYGTSHPAIARIVLQITNLVHSGFTRVPEEREAELTALLMEIAQELIYVEERLRSAVALEDEFAKRIRSREGVGRQPHAISFEDPSQSIRKEFEDGVIHLAIAHRKLARAVGMILARDIKGGNELLRELRAAIDQSDPNITWLDEADEWFTTLYTIRGDIEHEELGVTRCNVAVGDGDTYEPVHSTLTRHAARLPCRRLRGPWADGRPSRRQPSGSTRWSRR